MTTATATKNKSTLVTASDKANRTGLALTPMVVAIKVSTKLNGSFHPPTTGVKTVYRLGFETNSIMEETMEWLYRKGVVNAQIIKKGDCLTLSLSELEVDFAGSPEVLDTVLNRYRAIALEKGMQIKTAKEITDYYTKGDFKGWS
jgi:hypothetical protein